MRERRAIEKRNSAQFAAVCEALLERGAKVRFRVQGQSMQPNILNNDAVTVAPAGRGDLQRGDVALTRGEGGFRIHRVVVQDSLRAELITRGDAGQENDPAANVVFGKVIAIERNGQGSSLVRTGIKFLHATRVSRRRLKLSLARRLGQFPARFLFFGLFAVLGLLFNASPAKAQADLTMSQTPSVSVVATGVNFTYTEIATNNGPNAVPTGTLVIYQQTPASTTFQSIAVDANWTCTTPGAGNSGPIICTYNLALANGATTAADPIVITESVNAGTAAGTTILNSATVTSQTVDPVPNNNTSVTTVLVEPVADADLALFMTASPTPVFLSSSLAYTIQVQNLGQASAATVQVADTIPTGTALVSATGSTGWTCTGTTAITCSLTGTMAQGATGTITITVTTPSTSGPISNTATISSATTDPVSTNNSATVVTVVQPLVCATPGNEGPGGTLTGIVNTYYPPKAAGAVAAGATTIKLGTSSGAAKQIASGDLLLIIQMQDALINSANTGAYGDGSPGDPATGSTNFQSTGLFEYVTATSTVAAGTGTLTFLGTGSGGGLLNSYVSAAYTAGANGQQTYQVIRVPQYTSATLSSGLVPLAWNGSVGGVLALDVASQLTLGGTVAADSLGFRGGGGKVLGGGTGANTDYRTLSTNAANASKGEGIAGTPYYLAPATITTTTTAAVSTAAVEGLPNGSFARGAPGNAGGGGTDGDPANNDYNSGGGAGGNGGAGGLGGYGWNSYSGLNTTDGGFGGSAFPATTSAVVMGGGGGAGTTNNGSYYISSASNNANCGANCTGIYSSGGAGGGIVIVHTGSVAGTGTITSNGQSTLSTLNDSTGGAGAGGTIIFFANNGGIGGLTVNANGGNAGDAWPNEAPGGFSGQRHGRVAAVAVA